MEFGDTEAGATCGGTRAWEADTILWQQYTIPISGSIVSIAPYFSGNGGGTDFRVGVYSDNSNLPDALLVEQASSVMAGHPLGFNEVTLDTPLPVNQGEVIWVAVFCDIEKFSCESNVSEATARRLRSLTFGSLPDPAGSTSNDVATRALKMKLAVPVEATAAPPTDAEHVLVRDISNGLDLYTKLPDTIPESPRPAS